MAANGEILLTVGTLLAIPMVDTFQVAKAFLAINVRRCRTRLSRSNGLKVSETATEVRLELTRVSARIA